MLRDPFGCAGRLNRLPQRDERSKQEDGVPPHRLIRLVDIENLRDDHAHRAGQKAQGQAHVGEQDHEKRNGKEQQRPANFLRAQILLRKVLRDDHNVAVAL